MSNMNGWMIRYGPIAMFLIGLAVYDCTTTYGEGDGAMSDHLLGEGGGGGDYGRRRLSDVKISCGEELAVKYNCTEEYCEEKVSGLINYLRMAECDMKGFKWLSYFVTIPWLLYLLYLLADSADAYFVPVLEHMVEYFGVPPSIAGITFLSFGNGAPDVFSAIVSYSSGSGGDIGLGALLGSGAYVTCIICAVIAFYAPEENCTLYRRPFVRDVIFYLITLLYMVMLFIGKVSITAEYAIIFVLLYVAYILFVVIARYIYQTRKMHKRLEQSIQRMESARSEASGGDAGGEFVRVESAIDEWGYSGYNSFVIKRTKDIHEQHHGDRSWGERVRDMVDYARRLNTGVLSHRILDEEDVAEGEEESSKNDLRIGASNRRKLRSRRTDYVPSRANKDLRKLARHNSGVEIRTVKRIFSSKADVDPAKDNIASPTPTTAKSNDDDDDDNSNMSLRRVLSDEKNALDAPLIDPMEADADDDVPSKDDGAEDSEPTAQTLRLWWATWLDEFQEQPLHMKIVQCLLAPMNAARSLSIPLAGEDEWCREAASLSPILGSFVVAFALGPTSTIGGCPDMVIAVLCGLVSAALLYRVTRNNLMSPPKNGVVVTLFLMIGFMMSIIWIYLIANEIVSVLQCLGEQMSISDTALGLTVLAWANSAPDTISIAAVAREGKVQMAIGGVYAGRMFDTSMGLGLGMFISALNGKPVPFGEDATAIPSFVTLFLSVGAALVVVPLSGYKYTKKFGLSLIALYVLFMPIALLVSFGVI